MMRWMLLALPLVALVEGCMAIEQCSGDEVLGDDGKCYIPDTDTDETDTVVDTDTEPDVKGYALITVEWQINRLPNDTTVIVDCDDRELLRETNFTFNKYHTREFRVDPDVPCTVTFTDARGGQLPAGRILNCNEEVGNWADGRGLSREVASITTFECVEGCADPVAENYDETANLDDGSCQYILGCTDPNAFNYDPGATKNDGSCDYGGFGTVELVVFFDDRPSDTNVKVVCGQNNPPMLTISGVTGTSSRPAYSTLSLAATVDAGFDCRVRVDDATGDLGPSGLVRSCGETVLTWDRTSGPTNQPYTVTAGTFFSRACSGCSDPLASNYDATALIDDGTCTY